MAHIVLYYRGNPLEPVDHVLQRTVFTKKAREELLSYERDKAADAKAEAEKNSKSKTPDKQFR